MADFDATANINVNLRGFQQAANRITASGGTMSQVFRNLAKQIDQVALVEKKHAAELNRSLGVYSKMTSVVRGFAAAIQALVKNEHNLEKGTKLIGTAFGQLRSALDGVTGKSAKETERLQRTLSLYERQVTVIKNLAQAYQTMAAVNQRSQQLDQAATREKNRADEAARKLAQTEQRLALARQSGATAARNAATSQARAQQQLLSLQSRLAAAQNQTTAATQRSTSAFQSNANAMNQASRATFGLRSALEDLEGVYRNTVQAILLVGTAAISTAISHEAAFAQVARVTELTGAALEDLGRQAVQLTAELPVGFEELARAMQLASQTGIANDQLIEFSRTVVNFSVTTGIATEQVTLLFGRIQTMRQIPIAQMDNFASAVLALGVTSAATEDEILKITESIATVTDIFGLSTQATLGLSSALANLRVRPELSRGALTRIFRELTDSVASGGERLKILSQIMGQTQDDLVKLLETNPDQFFLDFVKGLGSSATSAGGLQRALRSLNINAVRDIDTISRLANNYDLLEEQVTNAYVEFELGNKLQKQAGVILETTRQKIDNLKDAFGGFLAQAGKPFASAIGDISAFLTDLVELVNLAPGPIKVLGLSLGTLLALGGAFAAYRLAVTGAMRVTLAFNEAQSRGGAGSAGGLVAYRGLRDALNSYIMSATGATRATAQLAAAQTAASGSANALRNAQVASVVPLNTFVSAQQRAAQAATSAMTAQGAAAANAARTSAVMGSQAASIAAVVAAQRNATTAAQRFGTVQNAVTTSLAGQQAAVANTAVMARNLGVSMTGLGNVTRVYGATLVGTYKAQQVMAATTATANAAVAASIPATTGAATAAAAFGRAGAFVMRNWLPLALIGVTLVPVLTSLGLGFSRASSEAEKAGKKAFEAAGGFSELSDAIRADQQQGAAAGPVFATLTASLADLNREQLETAVNTAESSVLLKTYGSVLGTISTSTDAAGVAARRQGDAVGQSSLAVDQAQGKIATFNQSLKSNTFELRDNTRAFIENTLRSAVMGSEIAKTADEVRALQAQSSFLQKVMSTAFEGPVGGKLGIERSIEQITSKIAELRAKILENGGLLNSISTSISLGGGSDAQIKAWNEQSAALQQQNDDLKNQITILENTGESLKKVRGEMDRAAIASLLFGDSSKKSAQDAKGAYDSAGNSAEELGEATQALTETATQLSEAYASVIDPTEAWKGANEGAAKSISDFTKRLQDQITAAQDFAKNLAILSAQGFTALVDQLRQMGPAGAEAAAQLVNGTGAELRKLEGIATQAGTDYKNALSTTLDVVAQMTDLGAKNAKALTDAIVTTLNQAATTGGDIGQAQDRILAALQLISKEKIAPQVVIDVLQAQGQLDKIREIIATAQANGSLDAKGAATLNTLLYSQALASLTSGVAQLEAEGKLDAEGKGKLTVDEYNAKLKELQNSVAASILSGVLDPKGRANLDDQQYRSALDTLSALVLSSEEQGRLNPDGSANLNPTEFNRLLDALRARVTQMERDGQLNPDGVAKINPSSFNSTLRDLRADSAATGRAIQANLTRTATVRVGYEYYQKNSPPRSMAVATGGWINGPGGPTDDAIPAMLSNGEFVVRAAQARRFGALLEAINSGRINSGVAANLSNRTAAAQMTPLSLVGANIGKAMTDSLIQRLPTRGFVQQQYVGPRSSGPVINITNQYPQAEPTSVTINRSLAYAATINGV